MPAEVDVASAGVTLVASFARFKASMVLFSDERTPSRPFGRWDFSAMVEATRKRCYVQAVKNPCLCNRNKRPTSVIGRFVQSDPFSEENRIRRRGRNIYSY